MDLMKFTMLILAASAAAALSEQTRLAPVAVRGGETIAFVGDSITHNGYHQMFLEYYYSTRFPETELQYLNRGTAGQSAFHLLRRMRTDILKPKADVYVLMVGMNDVGRKYFTREERAKNPKCEEEIARLESVYAERLAKVAEKLAENSRRLYIFSPSIFDETLESPTDPHVGLNARLGRYGKICEDAARRIPNAEFVDIWAETVRINADFQSEAGRGKTIIGSDRVHPSEAGGFAMAAIFLKSLGEPATVCSAKIDRENICAVNCEISNVKQSAGGLRFESLEYALPLALTPVEESAAKYIDFRSSLNKQTLAVKNLPSGKYALKIDGKKVGVFHSAELARGIDTAALETPQIEASRKILALCKKIRLINERLRFLAHLREMFADKIKDGTTADDAANAVEEIGRARNNPYYVRLAQLYREYAPRESLLRSEREDARAKIRALAAPRKHKYALEISE